MERLNFKKYLESLNIDPTNNNTYIYLIILIQKVQLLNNLLKILSNNYSNKYFKHCLKYVIINSKEINDNIKNDIKLFKSKFNKNELINDIMQFIKNNIQIPAIDFDTNIEIIEPEEKSDNLDTTIINNKILKILSNFKNIDSLIKNIIKNNYIEDNDIYIYCTKYIDTHNDKFNYEVNNKIISKEINNINIEWNKLLKDNNQLYLFINQYINLND